MGTDSRSHTHRCTGTKFWCDRRAHTHGDTCRYTSAPGKTSGVARGAGEGVPGTHGHTQGPAHTTRACAHHNPAPSPQDQFRRPRAAPAKRGGFESVSPQFLALPGPRGPPEAPRPAVARTCRPHEARQQPPQSGPSAGPTRCVHARRESCGPFGAPKNYNSQKAPRCAHTATEGPPHRRAGVTETTTPRRPCVRTLWKEDSQPLPEPEEGGAGKWGRDSASSRRGRSPQSLERLRIREAKLVTPGHTALRFACHSSPLSNGSHLSQTIAVVPPESRESEKLIDVGK